MIRFHRFDGGYFEFQPQQLVLLLGYDNRPGTADNEAGQRGSAQPREGAQPQSDFNPPTTVQPPLPEKWT